MSTEASLLPSLAAAKMITTHKKKPKVDPETEAISTLCKTLNATVMKLIYSNAALMAEQTMAPDGTQSGLTLALRRKLRLPPSGSSRVGEHDLGVGPHRVRACGRVRNLA